MISYFDGIQTAVFHKKHTSEMSKRNLKLFIDLRLSCVQKNLFQEKTAYCIMVSEIW